MTDELDRRIGDRERLAATDHLRDAYGQGALDLDEFDQRLEAALTAKTRGELEPLLRDLPEPLADPAPAAANPAADHPAVVEDDEDADEDGGFPWGWLVVFLIITGGFGVGDDVVEAVSGADAVVFGSRTVDVGQASEDVQLLVLFGSVEVRVDEEVTARTTVTPIFGSAECETACGASPEGEEAVTISGLVVFGSVEVTPAP